jgi:hypothetical protein
MLCASNLTLQETLQHPLPLTWFSFIPLLHGKYRLLCPPRYASFRMTAPSVHGDLRSPSGFGTANFSPTEPCATSEEWAGKQRPGQSEPFIPIGGLLKPLVNTFALHWDQSYTGAAYGNLTLMEHHQGKQTWGRREMHRWIGSSEHLDYVCLWTSHLPLCQANWSRFLSTLLYSHMPEGWDPSHQKQWLNPEDEHGDHMCALCDTWEGGRIVILHPEAPPHTLAKQQNGNRIYICRSLHSCGHFVKLMAFVSLPGIYSIVSQLSDPIWLILFMN